MTSASDAELKDIAEIVAQKAVEETLLKLGIDVRNPLQAQQDFVVLREMRELMKDTEFQADIAHLQKWRKSMDSIQTKGLLTVVTLFVTGLIGLLVMGLKGWIKLP